MKNDLHEFDTSDYPQDNQFGIPLVNKKKVGLMEDECNGKIMREFVGLRSKMYSVKTQGQDVIKKAKGVKISVVNTTISFDDYMLCLFENITMSREQKNIRTRLHVIRTEKQDNIALSPRDDKRYLMPGTMDMLPWGHYLLWRTKWSRQQKKSSPKKTSSSSLQLWRWKSYPIRGHGWSQSAIRDPATNRRSEIRDPGSGIRPSANQGSEIQDQGSGCRPIRS